MQLQINAMQKKKKNAKNNHACHGLDLDYVTFANWLVKIALIYKMEIELFDCRREPTISQ